MWTWDELVDFFNKNTGPIIGFIGVLVGILLNKFAPWLFAQLQRLLVAFGALVGGNWQDYQFERKYLGWIIGRHRYLGQLPSNVAVVTGEQRQLAELEKVYVALSVTVGGAASEERAPDEMRAVPMGRRREPVWWSRFVPARWRPDDERPYSNVGRAIEQSPRLVIRGDPGSGKTTLMKYLAVTCARALRNQPRQGDDHDATYERLGWKERPFPIFVSLGRHGNLANWSSERSLFDACVEEFNRELSNCPQGFFERRLKRGGCLILLDAFDELGSREARQRMAEHITGLLNRCDHAKNRVVVTTRIVGYEGQLDTRGFTVQTVQPLDDDDIESLVQQRYRAIALNESRDRLPAEIELAQRRNATKAEQLLNEIKRNDRLHSLAVNPLLLSLIVLDHSVKLVLPDDRHILYRDCIEILAARWRQYNRAALNATSTDDGELTLTHKITLLQAIAVEMQKQRTRPDAQQIPIRRVRAETIIAEQLPACLTTLPADAHQRRAVCAQKAEAWLEGIKHESGILIEVGLNDAGEPVIAFSHLTFQEYLAAFAVKEQLDLATLLQTNLLNPAWEEVLLLHVGIVQEATSVLRELIARAPTQPAAWLVAGRCLTERAKVDEAERTTVMRGLHDLAHTGDESQRLRVAELLAEIGSPTSIPTLVELTAQELVFQVRYTVARTLGKLGDPRFEHTAPEMVTVPAGEFVMGEKDAQHKLELPEFRIGKYPVTNAEFKRFVEDGGYTTKHRDCWLDAGWVWRGARKIDQPPYLDHPQFGLGNCPVVTVAWYEAIAYCNWLSKTNPGRKFRLPTEAEWEKAARGTDGREYPWGNEFDSARCNTGASKIGTTTPVGLYPDGASPCGALDMAGNVWEWCSSLYQEYPYKPDDGRENLLWQKPARSLMARLLRREDHRSEYERRVFRGGSWSSDNDDARCAYRSNFGPVDQVSLIGCRVAEFFPT